MWPTQFEFSVTKRKTTQRYLQVFFPFYFKLQLDVGMKARTKQKPNGVHGHLSSAIVWSLQLLAIYVHQFEFQSVSGKMCWYLVLILGIWIVVSFLTYRYLAKKKNAVIKEVFHKKLSNVLFVIAHPDDECMFFGPAITALVHPSLNESSSRRKKAKDVYVLCLSDGNSILLYSRP